MVLRANFDAKIINFELIAKRLADKNAIKFKAKTPVITNIGECGLKGCYFKDYGASAVAATCYSAFFVM